jgi:hypothetical protein
MWRRPVIEEDSEHSEHPWNAQCVDAAYQFGLSCANLVADNRDEVKSPLDHVINALMTELWDRNFSQTEIRKAFEAAIKDMPRYAAGQERRSATSSVPATADWLSNKQPKA